MPGMRVDEETLAVDVIAHQPTPLSDDVRKKLDFMVEEAKRKRQSD